MRIASLYFITVSIACSSQAQTITSQNSVDVDLGFARRQGTLSTAIVHDWYFGKKKQFVVGLGGRGTLYTGRSQSYVTAPAALTSGKSGPLIIFKENIVANMDTFLIPNPGLMLINAEINLGYRFNERLSIGFNIDAVGFSLGAKKNGNYINGAQRDVATAKPTPFDLLLISDNDRGSLNSQLYAKQKINSKWSARVGLQFLFTEYTTSTEVQHLPQPNDRFRRKSLMFMFGTSFTID